MPVRIETIDAIARRLGRDVIFLDIRDRLEIAEATAWLDAEGIGWAPFLRFVPGMLLIEGGPRAIYIETPFEPGAPALAKLEGQFETPDGHPCHPDLILTLLTPEDAVINAEQDTPGFWDNI
jgi:hypothetical protein